MFLSYARDDVARAKALAAAIERAGHSVWWDRDLEGGAEYSLEIDEALKSAGVVVVLWSKHSVGSAWVRDEAAAGRDTSRLVPVRLDSAEPPLGFRQFQTIDLTRWNGRSDSAGVKTLKSAIAAKLGRKAAGGAAAAEAPRTIGRPPIAALLAGLLVLAALAGGYFWYAGRASAEIPGVAIIAAPTGGDKSRSQAMARSLSVEVGAMQAGATSAFELRDTAGGVPKDVDYLVEVAASSTGLTVGADLSLLDRKDRQILWTGHFEKPAAEQADLRPQAALSLQPILSCLAEASGGSLDHATLKLYLRGCEKFADSVPGLVDEDQVTLLKQVVDRAPQFAPAIAHLALMEANAERKPSARALIDRAKALDPKLAKIYLAQSELQPRRKWRERQAPLLEGIRVNPDAAALHSALAFQLGQVGLRNDGIAAGRRAVELDPASPFIRLSYIQLLTYAGRLAEAEAEIVKAEKIWPTSKNIHDARWAFDLRVGDAHRALEKLKRDQSAGAYIYTGTRIPEAAMLEAFLQARIDPTPANIEKTLELYRAKVRLEPHLPGTMLLALATFDRVDEAYAIIDHPKSMTSLADSSGLMFRSYFKKFRQDPRFMPLAARIGLVRYWSETGRWPDFCFEPDLPYDCKAEAAKLKAAGQVR
ncbi:MAG TPA: TIR domain-containing protein [Sphingomicrobium sp.]|nr:TIR domain-containing protein [Sphingomicrobium sp.]